MGKTLYFDCFSGASGDMILGALLDLGLPMEALRDALGSLALDGCDVSADRVVRAGLSAVKFRLQASSDAVPAHAHSHDHHGRHDRSHAHDHPHPHDHSGLRDHRHTPAHGERHQGAAHHHDTHGHHSLPEIRAHIDRSALSQAGKDRAKELFARLAEAEAAVHGIPVERVHLHEVGALDSIVDIVGAVFGLEWAGADTIVSSPVNVGGGTVRCAHGVYPVPAPATARLLQGVPVYSGAVETELTTPTGALIVTGYARSYGPMPPMRVTAVGYGAGDKDFTGHPNVLRLMAGESAAAAAFEPLITLECEIDDMNPQLYGPLMDRLYEAGALDVYYCAVQMKKNRPGTLVTVLAPPERREALSGVLFAETTTIGVRFREALRERLERQFRVVETPLGPIRFKVATREGRVVNAAPEFEDCARVAAARGLPVKDVQARAMKAWMDEER